MTLLLLLFVALVVANDSRLELGRLQYQMATSDSQMPRYGECWKKAVKELEDGCKALDDEVQGYLALLFANCFLAKSGLEIYPCPKGTRVRQCLDGVSNNAFTAYSNFYTHTQNMCYFLQSQVWHDETEATIDKLAATSERVSKSIDEAAKVQEELSVRQKQSLEFQRQLAENGSMLSQALDTSRANIRAMLSEFKTSTDEQRTMIFEIFDRVSKLQNLVVGEISWLYTVVFYGTCLFVVYLGTATRRTADARLWLYCVLTVNFLLERSICNYSLPETSFNEEATSTPMADELPEIIYERIWLVRKLSVFACFCVTGFVAYNYVDYNKVNNRLLEDIRKQNADLKRDMERIQLGYKTNNYSAAVKDVHDGSEFSEKALVDPITGGKDDEGELGGDESSDDDDTLSFDSMMSDRTWMGAARDENGEVDDVSTISTDDEIDPAEFFSARNTNNNSPEPEETDKAPILAAISKPTPETPRGSSRRSSRSSRANTPANLLETSHRYNLRKRSGTPRTNPICENETAHDFAREVRKMASICKRNAIKVDMASRKSAAQAYSSDEA